MGGQSPDIDNARYAGEIRRWVGPAPRSIHRWLRIAVFFAVFTEFYILAVGLFGDMASDVLGPRFSLGWWLAAVPGWAVFMAVVYGIYRIGPRRRRLEAALAALRTPDSVAIVRFAEAMLTRSFARRPDRDALLIHIRVRLNLLYGEVVAAREALSLVDWPTRAPMIHALGVVNEAGIALLCTGEAKRGLALVRRALEMSKVRTRRHRVRRLSSWRDALLGLGEVLAGEATPQTLRHLRFLARRARDLPARYLATRALYVAYHRAGDRARADAMRRRLERDVPCCEPLLAPPDGPPPGAEWARDPGPPSGALLENAWTGPRGAAGARR